MYTPKTNPLASPIMKLHQERTGKSFDKADKKVESKKAKMQSMSEEDGKDVAREHGAATHIEVDHDHESGSHRVHSEHPDGHVHESEHATAQEAQDHASDLAGDGEEGSAGEEPEMSYDDEDGGSY